MFLPGILYLTKHHPELFKTYSTKMDITKMFYNAPIIPACRDVTTFEYKGKYWRCSRLHFGIQPAPYFAIRLKKVVLDWIRSKGLSCWYHIDDILITSDNSQSAAPKAPSCLTISPMSFSFTSLPSTFMSTLLITSISVTSSSLPILLLLCLGDLDLDLPIRVVIILLFDFFGFVGPIKYSLYSLMFSGVFGPIYWRLLPKNLSV